MSTRLKQNHNENCRGLQPLQNASPLPFARTMTCNVVPKLASGLIRAKPMASSGVCRLAPMQGPPVDKHRHTCDEARSRAKNARRPPLHFIRPEPCSAAPTSLHIGSVSGLYFPAPVLVRIPTSCFVRAPGSSTSSVYLPGVQTC